MKASKKTYGVLGFPVKHSLSPAMHNAALSSLGIEAEYRLFDVAPDAFGSFLAGLEKNNIYGFNVTVPYKERIMDFVSFDVRGFYLKQLRAVNTVVKYGDLWKAFNTDIPGFSKHLKEGFDPMGKSCAIVGAGGASRAVAYSLAEMKAGDAVIYDIDRTKAGNVCQMVRSLFPEFNIAAVDTIEGLDIRGKDLLVNATPVGLKLSDPSPVPQELLHKKLFVYDLIYNPQETKLLSLAKKAGSGVSNGLGMLLYQGALSFEHFIGVKAPIDVMREALSKALQKEEA